MIGGLLSFVLENGWIGGLIGGAGGLLSAVLGGWKKWAVLGVAFLALGIWIGALKITAANLRADLATAQAEVAIANASIESARSQVNEAKAANDQLLAAYEALRLDAEAAVAAVTKDRDRIVAEGRQIKTVREKIHASATACTGEPPPYTDALDWLRDTRPESR